MDSENQSEPKINKDAPAELKPELTGVILVIINVIIFIILNIIGDTSDPEFLLQHGAVFPPKMIAENSWYPMLTAMFLHFDIEHLTNNMIMLIAVGSYVERELGKGRFLLLYLGTGIIGNVVSFMHNCSTQIYTVSAGASGAVFGLVGGLMALAIKQGGRVEGLKWTNILLMIALSIVAGLTSSGVDNVAHVAGLISGVLFGLLLCIGR